MRNVAAAMEEPTVLTRIGRSIGERRAMMPALAWEMNGYTRQRLQP